MAAVEVTISGVLYDKLGRTMQQVVLIGEASLTGLGVGGGPVIPPGQPPGQSPGVPTHPIMLPGMPGWGDPHPAHPIQLPPNGGQPPEGPPDDNGFVKPPPTDGGWGYHEDYGWGYYPGAGKPQPKR